MEEHLLEKFFVMVKPSVNWMTEPLTVAAEGNGSMLDTVQRQTVQPPGAGARVIEGLADLYRQRGRKVLLFESSQALERVTRDLGQPDPDLVFTVDYINGYQPAVNTAATATHLNILNTLTATPRLLEYFVADATMRRLGVNNIVTQPEGHNLEGGDISFIPHGIQKSDGPSESILVMGKGQASRTNDDGRTWLRKMLAPDNTIVIETDLFHRDLVSAFIQDQRGRVVQALLASDKIKNRAEIGEQLGRLGIDILEAPGDVVDTCALNVSVHAGDVIGMQSFGPFEKNLRAGLAPGLEYHVLPNHLQRETEGFTQLGGGANCVTGSIFAKPDQIDYSAGAIREINNFLHGKDFEDELRAHAERLDLTERIRSLRDEQRSTVLLQGTASQ